MRGHWHFYNPFKGFFLLFLTLSKFHCSLCFCCCKLEPFQRYRPVHFHVDFTFTFNWLDIFFFLFVLSIMGLQVGCLFAFYIWRIFKIILLRWECLANQIGSFLLPSSLHEDFLTLTSLGLPPGQERFISSVNTREFTKLSLPSSVNYDMKWSNFKFPLERDLFPRHPD